jgi:phosphate-selective porin OprO/OprP
LNPANRKAGRGGTEETMPKTYLSIALLVLGLSPKIHAEDIVAADTKPASVEDLDQRVRVLERQLEIQAEDADASKGSKVTVTADRNNGFGFYNADKTWGLRLSGLFQVDDRSWFSDNAKPQPNTFLPRRGRFQVDANIGPKAKIRFQEDFVTGKIVDAYGELKLAPWATVRTGLFKTPLSLERLRSDPARDFVELGYTGSLVTDRDTGVYLELADLDQAISLGAGVFDSSPEASGTIGTPTTDSQDDKDVVAKLFIHPLRFFNTTVLRDFGLGVATSAGNRVSGTAVAPATQYVSTGQVGSLYSSNAGTTLEDGSLKLVPQAYLFWNSLSFLGEYVRSTQFEKNAANTGYDKKAFVSNEAWQAQLGWVLTGEDASFTGVKLNKDSSHSWGAVQLVGRVQGLNFDQESFNRYDALGTVATSKRFADPRVSISAAQAWGVGLNYYPVDNVKLLVDWEQTSFTDGASVGTGLNTVTANRETENVLLSRVQYTF